jgi:hypothetical protein
VGKYYCSHDGCSEPTSVVETRISYSRIRRRRQCASGHRFATIEVPHDTPKRLKSLTDWLAGAGLDPDLVNYAKSEIDSILLGKGDEESD